MFHVSRRQSTQPVTESHLTTYLHSLTHYIIMPSQISLKHIPVASIIILFLWSTLFYTIKYSLICFTLFGKMCMDLIVVFGQAFKSNIILIVIWVSIFGIFKTVSVSKIAYKAIIELLQLQKPTSIQNLVCSICLNTNCDTLLPQCKHCFHNKCLQNWVKLNSTCPLCRTPISTIKQEISFRLVKYFAKTRPVSAIMLFAFWLWISW